MKASVAFLKCFCIVLSYTELSFTELVIQEKIAVAL